LPGGNRVSRANRARNKNGDVVRPLSRGAGGIRLHERSTGEGCHFLGDASQDQRKAAVGSHPVGRAPSRERSGDGRLQNLFGGRRLVGTEDREEENWTF